MRHWTMCEDGLTRGLLRLAGCVGSVLSAAILALFVFGEGEPRVLPSGDEWAMLTCFPGLVVIGMGLGWWRPLVGGLVTAGGLVAFYAVHQVVAGHVPSGPWFVIFALPGLFFLVDGMLGVLCPRRVQPAAG